MLSGYYRELRRQGNKVAKQQSFGAGADGAGYIINKFEGHNRSNSYFSPQPSSSVIKPMEFSNCKEDSYIKTIEELSLKYPITKK